MPTATNEKRAKRPAAKNGNAGKSPTPGIDWLRVARTILLSRAVDTIEEEQLVPKGLVTYQFSARGHDLAQVLLATQLSHPHDAAAVYYRSRPFVLALGLTAEEAIRSTMGRSGGISEGRDIGVVHNMPSRGWATVLPTSGDVGAQYSPSVGWAQAIRYRTEVLEDQEWNNAVAVALGGDASCATNGFWAALTIATTHRLPYMFFIEDNGYGISVPGTMQTPGANIANNLQSFTGLTVISGDGTEPTTTSALIADAVAQLRAGNGPILLRLTVPRLSGHSFTDNQAYKSPEVLERERSADPLPKLRAFMIEEGIVSAEGWQELEAAALSEAESAAQGAIDAPHPDPASALTGVFYDGSRQPDIGGMLARHNGGGQAELPPLSTQAQPEGQRINLIDAVRRTLGSELEANSRVLVFGEDVGVKGGVHGATVDLQHRFGAARVFDTSLNEEGIIGRAVGMALAGLMPVPEIQFRKYADPATEQINDCGTIRWRTAGKFAAPVVVRIPVGFGKKTGDPWHSVSGEAQYAHTTGWRIAYPSNAEDAAGLLRTALRGHDPVMFFEHRALLDTREARRPYPGDAFAVPFGVASVLREGTDLTIVTWGAMVHRAMEVAGSNAASIEVIDLRTICPWDKQAVLNSVRKTSRCLLLHEDGSTCGFGAEIAAVISSEAFDALDAPLLRLAVPDIPIPYSPVLMDAVVPGLREIANAVEHLMNF